VTLLFSILINSLTEAYIRGVGAWLGRGSRWAKAKLWSKRNLLLSS